jgi:hypothetical protein
MAPVTATSVGMAPQIIDDPKLRALMDKLNSYNVHPGDPSPTIDRLVKDLADSPPWRFEEQVCPLVLAVQTDSPFRSFILTSLKRLIYTNGYPHSMRLMQRCRLL